MVDTQDDSTPSSTPKSTVTSPAASGSPETNSGKSATPKGKSKSGFKRALWLFCTVLMFGCIAVFSYYVWSGYKTSDQVSVAAVASEASSESVPASAAETAVVSSTQADYSAELSQLDQQVAELARENQLLQESLTALASTTANEIGQLSLRSTTPQARQRVDWQLAEAEYLSRIASQRVVMEDRPEAAIALLESADRILADIGLPELRTARRQVAIDLSRLRSARPVDREGIYLQLDALAHQVSELSQTESSQEASSSVASDEQGWVGRQWDRLVASMKDSVDLRVEKAADAEPLLKYSDEALVKSNLVLLLRQAQLAVLQQQNGIFQRSLEEAELALTTYYPENSSVAAIVSQLETLANTEMESALPDLVGSSRAIRQAIEAINTPVGEPVIEAGETP